MNQTVVISSLQYPLNAHTTLKEWQQKVEAWIQQSKHKNANCVLFPEYGSMELSSLLPRDLTPAEQTQLLQAYVHSFCETFSELAVRYKIYIVAPSIPYQLENLKTVNRTFVFSSEGKIDYQDKLVMTRFEDEEWRVEAGSPVIKVFETPFMKFSVATCFDVEFSVPWSLATGAGAEVLLVPSCTETVKGAHRVHIGARARALENQCYTVVSQTIGEAPWSTAVDVNNGFAAAYATPDVGFTDDGILFKGQWNHPHGLICDLDLDLLKNVRSQGAVFNFKKTQQMMSQMTSPFQVVTVKL